MRDKVEGDEAGRMLTTRQAWVIATAAKTDRPCADCGVAYPYWVMQLDHVPSRGRKSFTIALTYTAGRDRRVLCTRDQLLAEIAKCDVVCANCHAERTHARGGQRWGKSDASAIAAVGADAPLRIGRSDENEPVAEGEATGSGKTELPRGGSPSDECDVGRWGESARLDPNDTCATRELPAPFDGVERRQDVVPLLAGTESAR